MRTYKREPGAIRKNLPLSPLHLSPRRGISHLFESSMELLTRSMNFHLKQRLECRVQYPDL
uniref:Uncharacterized protein n=1 Tax=Romanomermis culicivorax TaxID=13658 RepID=A0A915IY01_ROMCU